VTEAFTNQRRSEAITPPPARLVPAALLPTTMCLLRARSAPTLATAWTLTAHPSRPRSCSPAGWRRRWKDGQGCSHLRAAPRSSTETRAQAHARRIWNIPATCNKAACKDTLLLPVPEEGGAERWKQPVLEQGPTQITFSSRELSELFPRSAARQPPQHASRAGCEKTRGAPSTARSSPGKPPTPRCSNKAAQWGAAPEPAPPARSARGGSGLLKGNKTRH